MKHNGIQDPSTIAQINFPTSQRVGFAAGTPPTLPAITPPLRLPPPKLPESPQTQPREYTRPTYAERFQCIGSACEDTCCQGWGVPIDQTTYEKYRSTEFLKPHLGTFIQLNTSNPTTSDYARIPLTIQSVCPFLDAERLCGIQKQLGEEMLSDTCATYPRAVSTNAGQMERALNLSCPEAARLTLLHPDLLGNGGWRATQRNHYSAVLYDPVHTPPRQPMDMNDRSRPSYEPQLAIREFVLLLLTDRSYPVWQRLYLLGLFSRRLQTLTSGADVAAWSDANPAAVGQLLADRAQVAIEFRLRSMMDEIEARPADRLQFVVELLRRRVSELPVAARFLECVQVFELGLGCAKAKSEGEVLQAYAEGDKRYYRPLMARNPHLLENYLINYIFKNNYPFGWQSRYAVPDSTKGSDAESEYLLLCAHATLAETLLIGMAAHYREAFDLVHVVKLVQSLAKAIEHSKQFLDQIILFVRARNLNNPHGIALLLKQD
jgi:lysine-N-methylase